MFLQVQVVNLRQHVVTSFNILLTTEMNLILGVHDFGTRSVPVRDLGWDDPPPPALV